MIGEISGKYSKYQVFYDWVEMFAISIQNSCCVFHNELYMEREQKFIDISKKYSNDEFEIFRNMCNSYTNLLHYEGLNDWLGEIYMDGECGNKSTGQFFTPYFISKISAKILVENKKIDSDGKIKIQEPSCGSGGMIIGAADVMDKKGMNYQKIIQATVQDIDWLCVYMTYIQLSLIGIDAIVVNGDTLKEPYREKYPEERIFKTPKRMGVLI